MLKTYNPINATPEETYRFWNNVKKGKSPGECWVWQAGKIKFGYGRCRIGGRNVLAHRMSWTLKKGKIPKGILVLHRCDNPPCVNPRHLFLGTYKDNMVDATSKGRVTYYYGAEHWSHKKPECLARGDANGLRLHPESVRRGKGHHAVKTPQVMARGERAGAAKITANDVRFIRKKYATGNVSQQSLGGRFGITQTVVSKIIRRVNWRHIK